jgi:hypothetical protein
MKPGTTVLARPKSNPTDQPGGVIPLLKSKRRPHFKTRKIWKEQNMVMGSDGPEIKIDCAGESQQELTQPTSLGEGSESMKKINL